MCEKGNHWTIDACLKPLIDAINATGKYKTLLSCCGHRKYHATIIVLDKTSNTVFEWFTKAILPRKCSNGRVKHRYYVYDGSGYYFIPGLKMDLELSLRKTPRAIAKNWPSLNVVRIYLPKIDFTDIEIGIDALIHLFLTEFTCMQCVQSDGFTWGMCKDMFQDICACSLAAYLLEDYEVVTEDLALPETLSGRLLKSLVKAGFME